MCHASHDISLDTQWLAKRATVYAGSSHAHFAGPREIGVKFPLRAALVDAKSTEQTPLTISWCSLDEPTPPVYPGDRRGNSSRPYAKLGTTSPSHGVAPEVAAVFSGGPELLLRRPPGYTWGLVQLVNTANKNQEN